MIDSIFRSSLRIIGSIDGKHIPMECPKINGTLYYNNKGPFSMVLLAICDANYCFTLFDFGQYRSNNDSRALANSQLGQMFEDDLLHVPPNTKLPKDDLHDCPYFLLRDKIFPLKKWLMWPFPGKTLHDEEYIYNYRHARARRLIENCFGILSACFRILQKPIMASVQNVEKYILPYISLHNYLRQTYNAHYNRLVLLIWKISMETLYQENGDHKAKMRFSVIAFKVLMLFEVSDHGLMR